MLIPIFFLFFVHLMPVGRFRDWIWLLGSNPPSSKSFVVGGGLTPPAPNPSSWGGGSTPPSSKSFVVGGPKSMCSLGAPPPQELCVSALKL